MVLGENQIVSQVKQAYAASSEQGTTGRTLNRLFHHAFEVSKRVRTETTIGEGKVSVASVAVDIAKRIFEDFSNKKVLVVGAGEMAQLACEYLREARCERFVVMTRTLTNAKALADACQGVAMPFDQLDEQLIEADIVIAATACPVPFLTAQRVAEAQRSRRGRLLFFIDLAVPRNVDPAVGELEQVYVYDIDALGQIVAKNQQQRTAQLQACEQILDQEVAGFNEWLDQARLTPMIQQMYRDAGDVAEAELQRLLRRCPDLSVQQRQAIEQMVERLTGKFMHPCVSTLRRHGRSPTSVMLAGALHETAAGAAQSRTPVD
jgi:glutamyl-tRNA reductase